MVFQKVAKSLKYIAVDNLNYLIVFETKNTVQNSSFLIIFIFEENLRFSANTCRSEKVVAGFCSSG